jgi:hypothetical protein
VLLGDLFDYESPARSNLEILQDIMDIDFERVVENTAKYSGRFVILYSHTEHIFLFHDATATRKIYYTNWNNDLWIASQPHLLANILNLTKTRDPSKLAYYDSGDLVRFYSGNVGDTTYYDEIHQLLPNHYLLVNNFTITRYWPNKIIKKQSIKTAAEHCAKMVRGFVEGMASRYEIMLPLTAGKDSRTLLAAAYHVRDRLYIYSNKMQNLNDKSADIAIPKQLLKNLDLKFNIVDPYVSIEEEFKKVYFSNNPLASAYYMPVIYNYYINFSNKVNIPGNNVADQEYIFTILNKKLTAGDLTEISGLGKYEFANKYFLKWFSEAYEKCLQFNIHPMSLFYWEHRLTNAMQTQMDKDIAQDEINPFNSRLLISQYLSVKPRDNISPDYRLHRAMMKNLWPDVLKVPINPSRKNSLKNFFKILGVLKTMYWVRYSLRHSLSRPDRCIPYSGRHVGQLKVVLQE